MDVSSGKRLVRFLATGLACAVLLTTGCTTASKLAGKLPGPIGRSARDELLRSEVESDAFPSADQVGLGSNGGG